MNKYAVGLQALGAGLQGGDGSAIVKNYQDTLEREKRKSSITALMDRMGIGANERELLNTFPLEAAQQHLLGKMQPAQPDGVVIDGRLVDRNTGRVIGDYRPEPLDVSAIFNTPVGNQVREGLVQRGLPEHVANAFAANFIDESNLDPGINERNPIVPGSRGGFGLAQWTGPRRKALEAFATERGKPASDLDTQLDFLVAEMNGPESAAAQRIMNSPDASTAAQTIVQDFLRPLPQHQKARSAKYAQLDKEISKITEVLASGRGTEAQRESLKFRRERLMEEQAKAEPPAPADEYQRYVQEERTAGREPLSRIDYAQAKKGDSNGVTMTMPDGTQVQVGGTQKQEEKLDVSSAGSMMDSINGILEDDALDWSTGALSWTQVVPGTPMYRFGTRVRQLDGQAFLQAFNMLKGAGQITEIEGAKATQAVGRLDSGQSPEDYREALTDLRGILGAAMTRPRGWSDTSVGKIVSMSASEIGQLDLGSMSAEERAAVRNRLNELIGEKIDG